MLKPHRRVAALLRARRWAIAILAQSDDPHPSATARISGEAMPIFLALERCAGLLLSRIANATDVPAELLDPLRTAAAKESQSVLQARAEGVILSDIASRLDFPIIVLKGGVRAISGAYPSLPLVDIDLLVEKRHVSRLTEILREAGFGEPVRALRHHQGILPSTGRLAVEVHWTTHDDGRPIAGEVLERVRPIEGVPRLMQLAPRDNVEHLLRHAVTVHRDRSVALRDIALTGLAAEMCSDEDIAAVTHAISGDPHAAALREMLHFSVALAHAGGAIPNDPFVREAAIYYSAITISSAGSVRAASAPALAFALEIALGRTSMAGAPSRALEFRGTANPMLSEMARRFPRVIEPAIGIGHLGYYSAVAALLVPRIRRTAALALGEVPEQTRV